MLLKLLKNEFIHTGRMILWLLGGGIAIGGIGVLFTLNQQIGAGQFLIAGLWNFLLIVGALVLEVLGVVIILVSTNRSLFSERGYLTFALPVSSVQMLFAKFFTNVIYMLLCLAEAVGLVYTSFYNFRRLFLNAGEELMGQMGIPEEMKAEMGGMVGLPSFTDVLQFAGYLLGVLLVFLILAMVVVLFVFTISHVRPFQAKPSLWIPAFFVAVGIFCQQVVKYISAAAEVNVVLNFGGMVASEGMKINLVSAFVMLGLSVGFFFLTNWLLSRKISLK